MTPPAQAAPASAVVRPASVAEAAAALRDSAGAVLFRGAATTLDWAGRPDHPDLILDSAALRGVLTHTPGDMTASVSAGTPLAELQAQLAGHGQWLALDPPSAAGGATIGGLLASGDSGPSRLRYGGLRDLVIGVTLVLADGTVAHAGGHVIKNVAGYDLAKLMYGSLGSLAFIAEVVLRLHPRPPASATLLADVSAARATAASLALMASPIEPAALEWTSADGDGPGPLLVRIDGSPAALPARSAAVRALLAGSGIGAAELSPVEAAGRWDQQALAARGHADASTIRVAGLPDSLPAVAETVLRAAGSDIAVELASSSALGLHTVHLRGDEPAGVAAAITSIRAILAARGATVSLRSRPGGLDPYLDALGPPPSSVGLLRRVKKQFDPGERLAPGRFRPWF